jgi:hypothetical protein
MLFIDDFDILAIASGFFTEKSGLLGDVYFKVCQSFFCLLELVKFDLLVFGFKFKVFELELGLLQLVGEVFSAFFEGLDEGDKFCERNPLPFPSLRPVSSLLFIRGKRYYCCIQRNGDVLDFGFQSLLCFVLLGFFVFQLLNFTGINAGDMLVKLGDVGNQLFFLLFLLGDVLGLFVDLLFEMRFAGVFGKERFFFGLEMFLKRKKKLNIKSVQGEIIESDLVKEGLDFGEEGGVFLPQTPFRFAPSPLSGGNATMIVSEGNATDVNVVVVELFQKFSQSGVLVGMVL